MHEIIIIESMFLAPMSSSQKSDLAASCPRFLRAGDRPQR